MSIFNIAVQDIQQNTVPLSQYRGKVLMIVNTASLCFFTRQYQALQSLQDRFSQQEFTILAFPCNDFGRQEPGTSTEIASFCEKNFTITFPIFDKVSVRGEGISPLYKFLIQNLYCGGALWWNFEKFLIGKDGAVVKRYRSFTSPTAKRVISQIKSLL